MNFYKQYLILCDFELKEVDASQFDRFQSGKSRPHGLVCQFSRYPFSICGWLPEIGFVQPIGTWQSMECWKTKGKWALVSMPLRMTYLDSYNIIFVSESILSSESQRVHDVTRYTFLFKWDKYKLTDHIIFITSYKVSSFDKIENALLTKYFSKIMK